ncbi:MAG: STAS domain-containing protein [Desulfobacteraceae bacterium]|nr:STAS domain-containing protein [Desulfobacteraceae bacterium]
MDIDITVSKEELCSIVHVAGKIDAITSEDLEDRLLGIIENGEKQIILDLADTEYISSAGLRVLIVVTKYLYDSGHFCICNASHNVREIIEMAGFNAFMTLYDDLETARDGIAEE